MRPLKLLMPASIKEACRMLVEHRDEAKIVAGGQSLLPLLKNRLVAPKYLINIKGLPKMEYINTTPKGIQIGTLTVHHSIETSALIKQRFPILAEMEKGVGTLQIRNWGTIGGNIAHGDPVGDPGPCFIVLNAKVKVVSMIGEREIPLEGFFIDYLETVLEPDEILVYIDVPSPPPRTGSAYHKESVRLGDPPIASVAAAITLNGNIIKDARIVLAAAGKTCLRATKAEEVVKGKNIEQALKEVGEAAAAEAQPFTDLEGSEEYKREIIKVITRRVVSQAVIRAQAA